MISVRTLTEHLNSNSSENIDNTQSNEELIYCVNPHQYERMLKRREAKERLIAAGKIPQRRAPILHASRQQASCLRPRMENGKFLPGRLPEEMPKAPAPARKIVPMQTTSISWVHIMPGFRCRPSSSDPHPSMPILHIQNIVELDETTGDPVSKCFVNPNIPIQYLPDSVPLEQVGDEDPAPSIEQPIMYEQMQQFSH